MFLTALNPILGLFNVVIELITIILTKKEDNRLIE